MDILLNLMIFTINYITKTNNMKATLGMLKFFFIAVPVFIVVYCSAMALVEIKELIRK